MKVSDISTGLVHSWCSMFDGSIATEITHSSIFLMVNIFVCNKSNHNSDDNSYQWLIIHLSIHSLNKFTLNTCYRLGARLSAKVATANMAHHNYFNQMDLSDQASGILVLLHYVFIYSSVRIYLKSTRNVDVLCLRLYLCYKEKGKEHSS